MSLNIFWNHFFLRKLRKNIALQIYATAFDQGYSSNFHDSFVSHFPERLEHKNQTKYYRRMTRKPQSHFKILTYRTWVIIYKGLYCTHRISSVSQRGGGGGNRDVITPHVWIARRTNRDQLYLGIQARSWSFRRGVRFEIESHMRTEHCQEEKEKLGAKIRVFQNTFHFKARTEESVMILLV